MTASERIFVAGRTLWAQFANLTPTEVGLNAALSVAVVAAVLVGGALARRLLHGAARRLPGRPTAEKMVRTRRWARMIGLGVRAILAVAAFVLIAGIWGFDVLSWTESSFGRRLATVGSHLILLVAAATAANEAARYLIGHALGRMATREADLRRKAQLKTLDPLLRGLAKSAILIVATLMVLGEVGVKVGPLLAGAGVVGIALGFGAQTVVKDLLTGVFLIVEDIVSVGDVIQIGEFGGLVESMTLRTIRLRDFDGSLHVFPYGEAQVVHNLTKTFSYYVFNLQVSYSSDIDRALAIMNEVGEGMQRDDGYRDVILEPIEVVGVDNLADSGVVLKARIKTKPIKQWMVGREYNRRIKLAFDREGIEIPFPHMKVVLPDAQISELAKH